MGESTVLDAVREFRAMYIAHVRLLRLWRPCRVPLTADTCETMADLEIWRWRDG